TQTPPVSLHDALPISDPNPPSTGTLQGVVVAGNFPGTAPAGVRVNRGSDLAIAGDGQNTINPRIGFSWRLPKTERIVLRAGYGRSEEHTSELQSRFEL